MNAKAWLAAVALLMACGCGPAQSKNEPPAAPPGIELVEARPSLAKVRAIRETMFSQLAGASDTGFKAFEYPANMDDASWMASTLEGFEQNKYGVWCYDAASMLAAAYRLQGYEAVNVSFGLEDGGLTHAGVLVKVDGDWYYEDAYFNFEIPAPFFEAVRAVRRGEPLPVTMGPSLTRPLRVTTPAEATFFGPSPDCEREGDAIQCEVEFSTQPYLSVPLWRSTFARQAKLGVQGNLAGLFLFPFAVFDGTNYYREHAMLDQYWTATGCRGGKAPSCAPLKAQ